MVPTARKGSVIARATVGGGGAPRKLEIVTCISKGLKYIAVFDLVFAKCAFCQWRDAKF